MKSINFLILLSSFMYGLIVILIFQARVLAPSIFLYIQSLSGCISLWMFCFKKKGITYRGFFWVGADYFVLLQSDCEMYILGNIYCYWKKRFGVKKTMCKNWKCYIWFIVFYRLTTGQNNEVVTSRNNKEKSPKSQRYEKGSKNSWVIYLLEIITLSEIMKWVNNLKCQHRGTFSYRKFIFLS